MKNTNWMEPENITDSHAWRRCAARLFDMFLFLYILLVSAIILDLDKKCVIGNYLSAYFQFRVDKYGYIILPIELFLSAVCNATLMSCFSNTLGKYLFGIKILPIADRSINFKEAFKREMLVLLKGLWIGISGIVSLQYGESRADNNLIKNKTTAWDKQMNLKVTYRTQSVWITLAILIGLSTSYVMVLEMCKKLVEPSVP